MLMKEQKTEKSRQRNILNAATEEEREKLKAQIFERSQGASKIKSIYGDVHCGMTKGSKGKLITQEMVGTYINGRNPFRQLRITQPKPQGAN